jgi:hypothetical protein
MKAYRTTLFGICSIVLSESSGKAKSATVRSAVDAGYKNGFADIKCRRAPEYDQLTESLPCSRKLTPNTPYSIEYVGQPCGCSKCNTQEQERSEERAESPDSVG